jgi:hypothetical protein
MRVCHPGPVAFHRAITSAGNLSVMSFRGFSDRGRPPFFNLARSSMSVVSAGSSRYSLAAITCESIRRRSDFKVRLETLFFAVIGFPHAKDMPTRAAGDIAHHDQTTCQITEADHAKLTVVSAGTFNLDGLTIEDQRRTSKSSPRSASVRIRFAGS